jgi:hypothetical protein
MAVNDKAYQKGIKDYKEVKVPMCPRCGSPLMNNGKCPNTNCKNSKGF